MTHIFFWKGSSGLNISHDSDKPLPEDIVKIEKFENTYYLLGSDKKLWKGIVKDDSIVLKLSDITALDISASCHGLYYVNEVGRVYRASADSEGWEEVILHEEETSCVHGYVTTSHRVVVKQVSAGGMGVLFVSDGGELWASGTHPQLNISPQDGIRKVTFFEGRLISFISSGGTFTAVVAHKRDDLGAGNNGSFHSDNNEVFLSSCPQCTNDIVSPLSVQSDQGPLGVHFLKSSESFSGSSTTSRNNEDNKKSDVCVSSSSADSFQITENTECEVTQLDDKPLENGEDKGEKTGMLMINTEAARQFLTKQLSVLSFSTNKEDWLADVAIPTRIIKNNVTSMASYVYDSVKNVGDKVVTLSRHMSGGSDNISEAFEQFDELNSTDSGVGGTLSRWEWSESEGGGSEEGGVAMVEGGSAWLTKGKLLIKAEVWTWGSAKEGQLGLGDSSPRNKPSLVSSASHMGVVAAHCGGSHCLVLCLDGRTLSWGLNQSCQVSGPCPIGPPQPQVISTPVPGPKALSVAAGGDYSVYLTHSGIIMWRGVVDPNNEAVLCCEEVGGQWKRVCSNEGLTVAINSQCCHTVNCDLTQEQRYLEELISVSNSVVRPLLRRSSLDDSLANLAFAHSDVLHLTALIVGALHRSVPSHTVLSNHLELILRVYSTYFSALSDVTAVSGFTNLSRLVDLPDKLTTSLVDRLPSLKKTSPEALLTCAFNQPLSHIPIYKGMVCRGGGNCMDQWNQLVELQEVKKREAETTKKFWETSPQNLDFLRVSSRRLVRDSRAYPLSLHNANRFSSHWFVLFSDTFVHITGSNPHTYPLETLWIEQPSENDVPQNSLVLIMPEDTLTVIASSHSDKVEWYMAFNSAITHHLKKQNHSARSATHQFVKHPQFKDAIYSGRWLNGKLEGTGKLVWCDGRVYLGQFRNNLCHGYGRLEVPAMYSYEGQWKDGIQNGYGITRYENGDIYSGYYKDGLENGHGMKKCGKFPTSEASVYVGEWVSGQRHGYGVITNIGTGEKYLGCWTNNMRNGSGLIVDLDGIYYEGTFEKDILTGHGVMVLEDGSHYEGELKEAGFFAGKGVLTFSSGDRFEGTLHGSWNQKIKINGVLHKNLPSQMEPHKPKPQSFGQLSVSADLKWKAIFKQCWMGILTNGEGKTDLDTDQAWENIAISLCGARRRDHNKHSGQDSLYTIPDFLSADLDSVIYARILEYLNLAFDCKEHPLGRTLVDLVEAYNTTYGGMLVHPLLLEHAVAELHSITVRLYQIVKQLFPALPHPSISPIYLPDNEEVVSPRILLHPIILPKVYSSLFVLYSLQNKAEDDTYWRRLLKWNRHPDTTLLAFLAIDKKFWQGEDGLLKKENMFGGAIETLQQLKTTFSPMEKLFVLKRTFFEIPKAVKSVTSRKVEWSMNDLLPIFQYIVVRSHIQALGSEINFIQDFMESSLQIGELGLYFTTLQAVFRLILLEKINIS